MVALRWKAGILDFNGTILNDTKVTYKAAKKIFELHGAKPPSYSTYQDEATHNYMSFYQKHGLPKRITADELYPLWKETLKEYWHDVKLHRGFRTYLKFVKKLGMKTAIVSGEREDILHERLGQFKIASYFDMVVGNAHNQKKEGGLLKVANAFKIEPYDAFYLDDTFDGIKDAKHAGLHAFGFTKGMGSLRRIEAANPDAIINSYKDLRIHIEQGNWSVNKHEGGR